MRKRDNILIAFLIVVMVAGWCTNVKFGVGDELWNYQNICKMINGYKIYNDANVIITPLFFFIGQIVLKLFGTNIFIFRLYNIFIMSLGYFFIYLILKKLCNDRFRGFIYFLPIFTLTTTLCTCGANYNTLAMAFVFIGIYLNLKWIENSETRNIIQASLMTLVLFTKQNIGVYYIFGIFVYEIIINKNLRNIIKQIIILSIETISILMLFYVFGIFKEFINYAILGIGEFARENMFTDIYGLIELIMWLLLCIGCFITILKINKIELKEKQNLILLICIAFPMLLISYPINNTYHRSISRIILTLFLIYSTDILLLKHFFDNERIKKFLNIITIVIVVICCIVSLVHFCRYINYITNYSKFDNSHYFYGSVINEEQYDEYKIITNYIKNSNKSVIILSNEAALYLVPLKISNGAFDLPFLGNMGIEGEEGMIEKINSLNNMEVLLLDDGKDLFWQESKKMNEFVKENFTYKGRIEDFLVYEK